MNEHCYALCGVEPVKQEKDGSGDCNRQGVFRSYRIEKLNGVHWEIDTLRTKTNA